MMAGDKVTLDCMVDANPTDFTMTKWFHNDDIIDDDDERFVFDNADSVSLVINPVTPADAGKYKCYVENEVGSASSENSIDLEVLCEYQYEYCLSL